MVIEQNVIPIEQAKPYSLNDLDKALSAIYTRTLNCTKFNPISDQATPEQKAVHAGLIEANSMMQGIIAIVARKLNDLESIEPEMATDKVITDTLQTEKPEFHVCGVQLIENQKLVGTSLYSTAVKAKKIRDTLNAKFAQLRVNHSAKIVNYPVF